MNKILLALAAIVVVIGGFLLLSNKSQSPVSQTQTTTTAQPTVAVETSPSVNPTDAMQANTATITLTADGFNPSTLTIKAGTKVTWTNKSGMPGAIYSDPHPVHTLWPFLNLGVFADGASLSVTFDKAGTYTYHNHLNPSQKGTVVVQ